MKTWWQVISTSSTNSLCLGIGFRYVPGRKDMAQIQVSELWLEVWQAKQLEELASPTRLESSSFIQCQRPLSSRLSVYGRFRVSVVCISMWNLLRMKLSLQDWIGWITEETYWLRYSHRIFPISNDWFDELNQWDFVICVAHEIPAARRQHPPVYLIYWSLS